MKTYFASPEKSDRSELLQEIDEVTNNPIVSGLLNAVSGLFAVLNQHRQVLTLNESFMKATGVTDASAILGLRPGEMLNCVHATESEGGCGTSSFCSTCGAAIAIVLCLRDLRPIEKACAIEVERNGQKKDLAFMIKALPVELEDHPIILLFLQDITYQQKLASLERIFFHDVNNMVSGLVNSCQQLRHGTEEKKQKAVDRIQMLSDRLASEIAIQNQLVQSGLSQYKPVIESFSIRKLVKEIQSIVNNHPASQNKEVIYPIEELDEIIQTDISLLIRVLNNMVINALEATEAGGNIEISIFQLKDTTYFSVWNQAEIPIVYQRRLFQKNFSTKEGIGRGLGTYAMKLIGEEFLGGKVDYRSDATSGTIFSLSLKDI